MVHPPHTLIANFRSNRGREVASAGSMGPEEADVLIVLLARIYDLVSVREVPSGPQLHRCIRGRTDGSIRLCANLLQKPFALGGASTDRAGTAAECAQLCNDRELVDHGCLPSSFATSKAAQIDEMALAIHCSASTSAWLSSSDIWFR